jgi:hypothetical protein
MRSLSQENGIVHAKGKPNLLCKTFPILCYLDNTTHNQDGTLKGEAMLQICAIPHVVLHTTSFPLSSQATS